MAKITILVPKQKQLPWVLRWGKGGIRKRQSAAVIFNSIERRLSCSQLDEKTAVVVKGGKDTAGEIINETIPSCDVHYLLYATFCFFEDFLPEEFKRRKGKYVSC